MFFSSIHTDGRVLPVLVVLILMVGFFMFLSNIHNDGSFLLIFSSTHIDGSALRVLSSSHTDGSVLHVFR